MKLPGETVVMCSEPIPGCEPEDIQAWYARHHNEAGLAQAYAAASNKIWWVEDNVYDYEEGTPEHQEARRITYDWLDLIDRLKEEILLILRREGVVIPEKGQFTVLISFMERNGYYDGNGWWIPVKNSET